MDLDGVIVLCVSKRFSLPSVVCLTLIFGCESENGGGEGREGDLLSANHDSPLNGANALEGNAAVLQELDHGGSSGGDEGLGFDLESDLPEIEVLARFELESGNVIEFQADPLTDDIGYTERFIAGESTPVFPADADISLLELYLQIAPDNAPVPKRLLDAAPDSEPLVIQEALERELVDYAGELVPRTGILGLQSPPSVVEGGGGMELH